MFGLFGKSAIHEPLDKQREDLLRLPIGQLCLDGADCDQLPGAHGPVGSITNPIPVNGVLGEIKYLGKLRGRSGEAVMFHRIGSVASPLCEAAVDRYEVVCMDATQWAHLHFDMYHPRRSNLAPPGFTLVPFNKKLGMDLQYAFGCNELLSSFPHDLPAAVIRLFGVSPGRTFARKIEERLDRHTFVRPSQ